MLCRGEQCACCPGDVRAARPLRLEAAGARGLKSPLGRFAPFQLMKCDRLLPSPSKLGPRRRRLGALFTLIATCVAWGS